MILGSLLTVEQWDELKTKEQLYARFEGKPSNYRDPEMKMFYTPGEAQAAAEILKKAAETVRPVLLDIVVHHTDMPEPRKSEALDILANINLDDSESMATAAYLLYLALDIDNESSFINRIKNGNGVEQARAEGRAFARYLAFKAADEKKMTKFQSTAEYLVQMAEIRLGLRNTLELPEE